MLTSLLSSRGRSAPSMLGSTQSPQPVRARLACVTYSVLLMSDCITDVCARAVASELLTNPFMRVNTAPVRLYASTTGSLTLSAAPCDEDGVAVMGLVRQRKSTFGVGSGVKK